MNKSQDDKLPPEWDAVVKKYNIQNVLGQGSFGTVVEA